MDTFCLTVEEMRALEEKANALGVSYAQMMKTAGEGVATALQKQFKHTKNKGCLGLVGTGNNGGDALIALTRLLKAGWACTAILPKPRQSNDPLVADFLASGGQVFREQSSEEFAESLAELLPRTTCILDGLLGTGFHGRLQAEIAGLLSTLHSFSKLPPIVALDCPSGVDCNSGAADPLTLKAQTTLCIEAVKLGLLKFPAANCTGKLKCLPLRLPNIAYEDINDSPRLINQGMARQLLPQRPVDSHKGSFGSALIVAGSRHYTGAAYLAGASCLRSGVGLAYMAIPNVIYPALAGQLPEAIWEVLPASEGYITEKALEQFPGLLQDKNSWLIGPGLGLIEPTCAFFEGLFAKVLPTMAQSPATVIDADGLRMLSGLPDWQKLLPPNTVLTPHPGEMAALTGLSVEKIQLERLDVARHFAQAWGVTLVLKGAFTVVASPSGELRVLPFASSGLAHGGSGDVLAGLICGLLAQGMEPFAAASLGVWLHAKAARLALRHVGHAAAVLPGDLIKEFGRAMLSLG
ncbi:MAG TPA: NAD(P)H-hydrate dehydratase [Anaerolineaceae bacterium]|nr:NAD(P)H-hydrate dehydratase [Anaerolineaceae bacterium]